MATEFLTLWRWPGFVITAAAYARGFLASRHACARACVMAANEIRAARDAVSASESRLYGEKLAVVAELGDLKLEVSSLRATLSDRDTEIDRLTREAVQADVTIKVREKEIEELVLWAERQRCRMSADIALELAREGRAQLPSDSRQNSDANRT